MMKNVILLVEDNPDDQKLILEHLGKFDIVDRIDVAENGIEAKKYLFEKHGKESGLDGFPALIILDIKLPLVDGLEVLMELRSYPDAACTPVVVFSSSDEPKDIVASYESGCNSYVIKSVSFSRLGKDLEYIVTYWLTINVTTH